MDRLNHRPGQLSGGERQRVAVVRALINQPQLLLADEPTGALDRGSAENLTKLLLELNEEEKVTLIVVTHSLDLAKQMGRVLELLNGQLETVNLRTLILRSLTFHAKSHLGVILGAAVGAAVLIGALIVGDSMRGSLRDMALARLGKIDHAMVTNDRLFREQLATDMNSEQVTAVPVLMLLRHRHQRRKRDSCGPRPDRRRR